MLAYEVQVNGEQVAVAGMADWSVMSVIVSATRGREDWEDEAHFSLHIGGLTRDLDGVAYHTRWAEPEIAIGSEIRIRIVDRETADEPTVRDRSDREVGESPYSKEEMDELRYLTYVELKGEFEGGDHEQEGLGAVTSGLQPLPAPPATKSDAETIAVAGADATAAINVLAAEALGPDAASARAVLKELADQISAALAEPTPPAPSPTPAPAPSPSPAPAPTETKRRRAASRPARTAE